MLMPIASIILVSVQLLFNVYDSIYLWILLMMIEFRFLKNFVLLLVQNNAGMNSLVYIILFITCSQVAWL